MGLQFLITLVSDTIVVLMVSMYDYNNIVDLMELQFNAIDFRLK